MKITIGQLVIEAEAHELGVDETVEPSDEDGDDDECSYGPDDVEPHGHCDHEIARLNELLKSAQNSVSELINELDPWRRHFPGHSAESLGKEISRRVGESDNLVAILQNAVELSTPNPADAVRSIIAERDRLRKRAEKADHDSKDMATICALFKVLSNEQAITEIRTLLLKKKDKE